MDTQDARPAPDLLLTGGLAQLEGRLEELRGESDLHPEDLARALVRVELDAARLRREALPRGAVAALDAGLRHWRAALGRLDLGAEEERAHELLGEWLEAQARGWCGRDVDGTDAAGRLEALREGAALRHGRIAHLRGSAGGDDPLALRLAELQRELEASGAEPALRDRHGIWLLDASAEVLSSLDEESPEVGRMHLEQVSGELEWADRRLPPASRRLRARLAARRRRVRAELEERLLQERLEQRLGRAAVARLEQTVLVLIFLVLGLFSLELLVDVPPSWRGWLVGLETAACTVFLGEFFLKLALVPRGRARWFRRHLLVDLLPSIPFGLIASLEANPAQAGRLARLLRLPRVVRYVRVLLPVLRLFRVVAFMARGMDRIARAHRAALNRDVVITPDRRERARARARGLQPEARLERLEAALQRTWVELLVESPLERRSGLAALRTAAFAEARTLLGDDAPRGRASLSARTERTAEEVLESLQEADPTLLARTLGADSVARLARVLRMVGKRPLRWLPVLRRIVPETVPGRTDDELVAAGARRLGRELARHHGRLYWFADLHGTITPSELVDRAGTALVKSSVRPATRLLLFGGAYVVVVGLLELVPAPGDGEGEVSLLVAAVQGTVAFLERFVGTTLVVLGSICLAVLALGAWLKRLAQDATAFFEQAAAAQFLSLTEAIRNRTMERDVALLDERVVAPEARLDHGGLPDEERRAAFLATVHGWLLHADARTDGSLHEPTRAALERVVLLYRDALDGALLGESDTRATSQLLGNPALIQLRELSRRFDRRERKELAALDLERGSGLRGPYLWFSLLSRAVARSAARLIVEYNRSAIPLAELEQVDERDRGRCAAWIAAHPCNSGSTLPVRETREPDAASYRTSAFTALHFLDDDPARDAAVEARFGPEVRRMLQEDRQLLFCRIFGTYPLHLRPRSERFLNVARLYDDWLQGGRVFLLPLRVVGLSLSGVGRLVQSVARAARELRDPRLGSRTDPRDGADFETAVRKIDRMRGPGVRAAVWMRARFDPEYLALSLPGCPRPDAAVAAVDADLEFLGVPVDLREDVIAERERTRADLRRLARLLEEGLGAELEARLGRPLEHEHRRALAVAYCADLLAVRGLLSAEEALLEAFSAAPRDRRPPGSLAFARGLRRALGRWLVEHGREAGIGRPEAWRAVQEDRQGVRALLLTWSEHVDSPQGARREQALERLTELLRHPARVSEQLVNLRAVQSLALLDVLHYREHVWRLAGFEARGDEPGSYLELRPLEA